MSRGDGEPCINVTLGPSFQPLCSRCFWINLPTGGIAIIILFIFLNLNPHQGRPLRQHVAEFDFIGLGLIVSGVVCVLLGSNFSETSCTSFNIMASRTVSYKKLFSGSDPQTIALIVIGAVLLILGGINETLTKRSAIIPPRLFKVLFFFPSFLLYMLIAFP